MLAEQDFSSVLAEPLALTAPRRLAYLAALAVSWQPDADGWATTTTAFVEQSTQIVSSVQIVNSTSLLALSQSFGLPITVSNALDLPVTVYVTVDPQPAPRLLAYTLPPCCPMIVHTTASPSPAPPLPRLVRRNGRNAFVICSLLIPTP